MALYNEERPQDTSGILGQPSIVQRIEGMISLGKYAQAMAFTGPAGTGKTTTARVIARACNCENPTKHGPCGKCQPCKDILAGTSIDVIEMDAASNNGVADVHDIIEKAGYAPLGKYKVLIIDEAHMLSKSAWNAFLKIVEEPPSNVIFIFCTTELNKIPATIVSRCRQFAFGKISAEIIAEKLEEECLKYGKSYDKDALMLIAKAADGGMRSAESVLESFFHEKKISTEIVADVLGVSSEEALFSIIEGIANAESTSSLDAFRNASSKGRTVKGIAEGIIEILKDILYLQEGGEDTKIYAPKSYKDFCHKMAKRLLIEETLMYVKEFSLTLRNLSEAYFETVILKLISEKKPVKAQTVMCDNEASASITELMKSIAQIKNCLMNGEIPEGWDNTQAIANVSTDNNDTLTEKISFEITEEEDTLSMEHQERSENVEVSNESGEPDDFDFASYLPKGALIGNAVFVKDFDNPSSDTSKEEHEEENLTSDTKMEDNSTSDFMKSLFGDLDLPGI